MCWHQFKCTLLCSVLSYWCKLNSPIFCIFANFGYRHPCWTLSTAHVIHWIFGGRQQVDIRNTYKNYSKSKISVFINVTRYLKMPLNQRQMLFWQLHLRTGIELSKFQISIFKLVSKFLPMPEKLEGSIDYQHRRMDGSQSHLTTWALLNEQPSLSVANNTHFFWDLSCSVFRVFLKGQFVK